MAAATPRISQAIIVISGALTGLAAIAALSYYRHRNDLPTVDTITNTRNNTTATQTTTETQATSSSNSNSRGRLRRSRHVRIRRSNRSENSNTPATPAAENDTNANNSDVEEDATDNGKMLSLFKEWGDDDNRNLLNLLHAISENQSRKGTMI
jgi:hypothetical protein